MDSELKKRLFANQIEATYNEALYEKIPEIRFFGIVIRKGYEQRTGGIKKISTKKGDVIPDDTLCNYRLFKYCCKLINAITTIYPDYSKITLYLDGFDNFSIHFALTKFLFDPQLEGDPIVEISMKAEQSTRWPEGYSAITSVSLIFKDKKQMEAYVKTEVIKRVQKIINNVDVECSNREPYAGYGIEF